MGGVTLLLVPETLHLPNLNTQRHPFSSVKNWEDWVFIFFNSTMQGKHGIQQCGIESQVKVEEDEDVTFFWFLVIFQ